MNTVRVFFVVALAWISLAMAVEKPTVLSTIQPLLQTAVNSFNGKAVGVIGGAHARFLKQNAHIDSNLVATVTTAFRYKEKGCSRLHIDFKFQTPPPSTVTNPGIQNVAAVNKQPELPWVEMNYCRTGLTPKSLVKE